MKKRIHIYILIIIILLVVLFGKRVVICTIFYSHDITVNSFSACSNPYLCVNVEVKKNSNVYHLTIIDIQLSHFYSNKMIHISQLNGFSVMQYGCNSSNKSVIDKRTNKYVPYEWRSNRITLGATGILANYFGYHYTNIFDYLDVIDSIQIKLERIPSDRYIYWTNDSKDEVYIKRFKVASGAININQKDTAFKFQNCE